MNNNNSSSNVSIATISSYNTNLISDRIRADLSFKTVAEAVSRGFKVYIVDNSSSNEISKIYNQLGAKTYTQEGSSFGSAVRQVLKNCAQDLGEIIFWMEIEKQDLVKNINALAVPVLNGSASIVIPKRKSLGSYPIFQQYTEHLGNLYWKELTGIELDILAGPKMIKKEKLHYFIDYDGIYGDKWEALIVPVFDALMKKEKILSVEIDYIHPKEQTDCEEGQTDWSFKRLQQLDNITTSLHNRKIINKLKISRL